MISPVETWTARQTGLLEDLDAERLGEWQLKKVSAVIAYAQEKSRFYGEKLRATDPRSLSSLADLEKLPFTWPAELAREPLSFLCVPQSDVARVTTLSTSGTRGVKKRIFFTQGDLLRTVDFFAHGMRGLVGAGESVLILMSGDTEHSVGSLLRAGLARIGVSTRIGEQGWGVMEAIAAAKGADCIVGIPQEVHFMCRTDESLRPRSVLLSADYAPKCVVAAIEKTWQCRVFTHYGMTETGFGCAVQCPSREGHHLRDADLFVEIVAPETGSRLGPGERGEIVITSLCSEAMPLIRYRTGDLARMTSAPCGCGGILPRLGRVEGRRENGILLCGGSELSIHLLDEVIFAMPGVRGFEAALGREAGKDTLRLTVHTDQPLEWPSLAALFPGEIEILVRYAEVNPFSNRAKRQVRMGR